ncbi:DUF3433 domain-containing protein [Aspergillus candidus]|uniref:Uncharacterized protein n=1 Tax=Aspergillus candidus TaxID=41067 RepID=A0A2I2F2S4_ASPCN|nr:hypothetical protein BDW47DRAFT_120025 [Aspergillus candidus]PLB34886.1 hypothetical protein BDW47DRAFT_120025 [Aspergillus candidus]
MLAPSATNLSLRTVSSSRPQLLRTESQQSAAASDDYYSFSEHSSSSRSRSSASQATVRYATPSSHPASRNPSPSISRTHLAPPAIVQHPSSPLADMPREERSQAPSPAGTIRSAEEREVRFNTMSQSTTRPVGTDNYSGRAATPGVDDSPYLRFAINQLTLDEEVSGSRRPSAAGSDEVLEDRVVWDDELGSFIRAPAPPPAPLQPRRPTSSQPMERSVQNSVDPEAFNAVDPPDDDLLYPPLDYMPVVLRPWTLSGIILCCLLMIAGISFCNVWSSRHQGLWAYEHLGDARYFVMQYLPQILAFVITVWTFVIQAAVYRIMPFIIMAVEREREHTLQKLPILSHNFLLPDFSQFRYGEPLVGFALFTIWLSNLVTLPLLSCLFQAKWFEAGGQGSFRWASVLAVGWTLVALYGLLTIGLILLLMRFTKAWTGLMWDPVSLADLIPLIQRSNILHDFQYSETESHVANLIDSRVLRLGYWKVTGRAEVFYGIGEVDAPIRNPSLHRDVKNRKEQPRGLSTVSYDIEQNGASGHDSLLKHPYSPLFRHRWVPWFLKDISVVAWTVIVCALFIAFVLVSFIHDAIKGGFPPRLRTLPSTGAFSSSNFVYSFIPALIGNFFFLAWQPIDVYFRAVQPFAALSSPDGARADQSILLSYPSRLPFQVSALAFLNGHYRVAWISLMSLVSAALPILAGGVFIALWYPSHDEIRIGAHMPAFYALIVFCAVYMASFLCIWPGRSRYLPHDISTLADQISFLYQSPLLADKLLREPRSKTDLVTRLVIAPPGDREHSVYGFGVYIGRDGKEHLGIDRFHRPGRADMLITTGSMKACVRTGRACPGYPHPLDFMLRDRIAFQRKKRTGAGSPVSSVLAQGAVVKAQKSKIKPPKTPNDACLAPVNRNRTPTSTPWPIQMIPSSLDLPVEDTVATLFFNSVLYHRRDPLIRVGFMELLPQSYSNARPGSHLQLGVLAVAFFSVSAWTGQRALLQSAELFSMKAISQTRMALQGGLRGNVDEILMTALLLSLYDQFSALKEKRRPSKAHLRGAIALVKSLDAQQRDSVSATTLANAVQMQVVKYSLGLTGHPDQLVQIPEIWPVSPVVPQSASSELASASTELVGLRLVWQQLNANTEAPNPTQLTTLLDKATSLDTRIVSWTSGLPAHWMPVQSTTIPASILAAGVFSNRCDCYSDLWIASTWNFYRDSRIVIHNIILHCLRMLPPDSETLQRIEFSSSTIRTLATDICASVPFFLGSQMVSVPMNMVPSNDVEYPVAENRPVIAAHQQTAPLLGGWFVRSYLESLSSPDLGLDEELVGWMRGQMERILKIYTFDGTLM